MDGVVKTTFEDRRAPMITKYECAEAPEGYNFIIVKNLEKEITYKENVYFNTFEGLEILDHEEPNYYEMEVGPGETKTILIKANIVGFSM